MELLKKVDAIEVKRCFVVSQLIRKQKFKKSFVGTPSLSSKKRFLKSLSLLDFKKRLKVARKKVLIMSEEELDRLIKKEYKKRFIAFNNSDWYLGQVVPSEVGVWRRAGNLPLEWTNGSLSETAGNVEHALSVNSKRLVGRAKHVIVNMLKVNVDIIQKEKYLLPIIFKGGTGTRGRKRLKRKMQGDIDDGCMRSIALTIFGFKKIKAYIGYPKNIKNKFPSKK